MISDVDTNILLDILVGDPEFREVSRRSLADTVQEGPVTISEPVYTEIAGFFPAQAGLLRFLLSAGVRLAPSSPGTLYLAGHAWQQYTRHRPPFLVCPRCGVSQDVRCSNCGAAIRTRQHIVAGLHHRCPRVRSRAKVADERPGLLPDLLSSACAWLRSSSGDQFAACVLHTSV